MSAAWLNGASASAADVAAVLGSNYGHFTTMQVRRGAVQGLGLHLQRLDQASVELFGQSLLRDTVLDAIKTALQDVGRDGCTLRVTVTSRDFDASQPDARCRLDLLVRCAPPAVPGESPLDLKSFAYARDLPHLKHVGTFPSFHRRRLAVLAGHDDALFVDAVGGVSEGSFWNIGFWHGDAVVWPEAPALRGTCERLLKAGLAGLGVGQTARPVRLSDMTAFDGAFVCSARGVQAVARIDDAAWSSDAGHLQLLQQALASQPWQGI